MSKGKATRSSLAAAGRFARSIASNFVDAIRRETEYHKGEPHSALLFLTYRCTSRCRTCRMWLRQWKVKQELSLDQWINIADSLLDGGVKIIELYGGDILLRKHVCVPLIHHLKKRGAVLHIPLNSILLDDEIAKELVDSQVDFLYLSTDGVNKVHDEIRGVDGAFQRVQHAVFEIMKWRNGRAVPRVISLSTVSKYNVESLEHIARFARDAGFDEIRFYYVGEMTIEDISGSVVDDLEPTPFFMRGDETSLISPVQARLLKSKLKSIWREHLFSSIAVNTLNIDCLSERSLVTGLIPSKKCYVERNVVTVDPEGNVVACPSFHSFKYGNLFENSMKDIWGGERQRRFHNHLRKKGLFMCRHCILSVERNHALLMRLNRIYMAHLRVVQGKLAKISAKGKAKTDN